MSNFFVDNFKENVNKINDPIKDVIEKSGSELYTEWGKFTLQILQGL